MLGKHWSDCYCITVRYLQNALSIRYFGEKEFKYVNAMIICIQLWTVYPNFMKCLYPVQTKLTHV